MTKSRIAIQLFVCIRQAAAQDWRFSCNLQLHVLAGCWPPALKSFLLWGVRDPHLIQVCLSNGIEICGTV